MAISLLWPKPPRWPIQPGAVDPNQRWVWHVSSCLWWECASAGAAQRYVCLAQTRRTARTWQLNTGAAALRTRYGSGVSIPTTNGAKIEALVGGSPTFAAWEQNEPYTIALLIKGRSGGVSTKHLSWSGSSSTGNHILFLMSGTTPNLRPKAGGGGTVTITSSVAIVNDTTWSTIVGTWRPGRLELYVGRLVACLQHGGDQHQRPVRHLPLTRTGSGRAVPDGRERRNKLARISHGRRCIGPENLG